MILKCPKCQIRYRIDKDEFGLDIRTVRCSKCSHVWDQAPISSVEVETNAASSTVAKKNSPPNRLSSSPKIQTNLQRVDREVQPAKHKRNIADGSKKGGTTSLVVWLIIVTILLISAFFTYLKREELMDQFPFTEQLFDLVGVETLPPSRFFKITVREKNLSNTPFPTIDIDIENISNRPRVIPVLKIVIRDRFRNVVDSWDLPLEAVKIMPAEKKPITIEIKKGPPLGAQIQIYPHRRNKTNEQR